MKYTWHYNPAGEPYRYTVIFNEGPGRMQCQANALPPENPKLGDLWCRNLEHDSYDFWDGKTWYGVQNWLTHRRRERGVVDNFRLEYQYGKVDYLAQNHETIRVLKDQLLMAIKLIEP